MSYVRTQRALPPWPRLLAALFFAAVAPATPLFMIIGWGDFARGNVPQAIELLKLLAMLVGQSLLLAIPLTLVRWGNMLHPLRECLLIGALSAPGFLGYLGLVIALFYAPGPSLVIWLIIAALGAIGGACFWAVATDLGAIRGQQ